MVVVPVRNTFRELFSGKKRDLISHFLPRFKRLKNQDGLAGKLSTEKTAYVFFEIREIVRIKRKLLTGFFFTPITLALFMGDRESVRGGRGAGARSWKLCPRPVKGVGVKKLERSFFCPGLFITTLDSSSEKETISYCTRNS